MFNRFARIVVCGAFIAWCNATMAGNAAFTADGRAVYMLTDAPSSLDKIDVERGTVSTVNVGLGKDDRVAGLALAKDKAFYLITKNALWYWKPGEGRAKWLEPAPKKVEFEDVACNPKTDEVLITSGSALYYKRVRCTEMVAVGIRYQPGRAIESPVFLPDGSFLFSATGDLWHGFIERTVEESAATNRWTNTDLVAYRYAPLAQRETYNGTPMESGIRAIGVSRNKVYADFGRMGGSGWGRVIRLDLPVQKAGSWASNNTAKETAKIIGSVNDLGDTSGGFVYLCGSPDGHRVYYGDGWSDGAGRRPHNSWIINDGKITEH